MERLLAGYRQFRTTSWRAYRDRFAALAEGGQRPRTLVIACSDSRVDPQMIFAAGPGELFVVRNVANLVPPYAPDADHHGTSAAIEFAVRSLGVEDIVVMGHGRCGGINALLTGAAAESSDFVDRWIQIAQPARARTLEALPPDAPPEAVQLRCEHEAVKISLANLRSFPWLREAEARGALGLHGCHFDIAHGQLHRLDPETGSFPAVV